MQSGKVPFGTLCGYDFITMQLLIVNKSLVCCAKDSIISIATTFYAGYANDKHKKPTNMKMQYTNSLDLGAPYQSTTQLRKEPPRYAVESIRRLSLHLTVYTDD